MVHNDVITRTIYMYFWNIEKQFKQVAYKYNHCTDMPTRRKLREKKAELLAILEKDIMGYKMKVANQLLIPFRDLKQYPHLIDLKRKQVQLERAIL